MMMTARKGIVGVALVIATAFATPYAAQCEEIFPRIYAGGVSGAGALAIPENSDQFRASGGGLYIHSYGWDNTMTAEEKVAAQQNFSFSDTAVEIGFHDDTSGPWLNWYLSKIQNKGMRPKFVTANAFSEDRVPTVARWTQMLSDFRAAGVDEQTMIVATFEYANFGDNAPTLSSNKVSQRSDFQQIIAASGGLTIDVPPGFYLAREQAYRNWITDAIQWARSHGHVAIVIVSPNDSGTSYPTHVQSFVNSLDASSALPSIFVVENYSTQAPGSYVNIVGNEDTPHHQLGAARRLQTQYLPAVVGRTSDLDGDGKLAPAENANSRSDYDPSDFSFDFSVSGDAEGWNGADIAGLAVTGGLLKGTATTSDSRLTRDNIYIDGGRAQNMLIRMKASSAGSLQVYWATSNGSIAASNVRSVSYGPANAWKILIVPMLGHAAWKNQDISTLRIDPISVAGANFEIDWAIGSDGDYDRDGFPDNVEGFIDTNADGLPNAFDVDSDGDGVTDDRERVISKNRLDPSDMYFGGSTTSLAGNSEGWTPININAFLPGSGWLLRGTSANGDAQIVRGGFHFAGASASRIQIYFRSSLACQLQLFWGIEGNNSFTASRRSTMPYTTPNQWQLVTFDMSTVPSWASEIIQALRVDPTTATGQSFEIRSISALP